MQTLLSRFCEEFVRILQPLLPPLGRTAEVISKAAADAPGKGLKAPLTDLKRQLEMLSEKVIEQQAYVLIFGPLKSGKSTLMNGIAGSYVSEVSSLPAYPCMVFVSHAPERGFTVTRYSGKTDSFVGADELKRSVERAHNDLATKLREAELANQDFDPTTDFEDAINRIDVRIPTNELGQSRAVMVDTPGLYSRMKFGYDRMTRDFRNAAACAIFVVRSDNLFLEQVFAEFTDLLELFSRIFLVVNIDSAKQDLGPDGTLMPSLEQRDPARVIDAFEKLAMSTPLREAADKGRLRIYPIDLLRSAQSRMAQKSSAGQTGATASSKPAVSTREFDRFFKDLTEYLDSSEYLLSFLGDSLRRASMLLGDADKLCTHTEIEALRKRLVELEKQDEQQETRRHALERLEGAGWTKKLEKLAEKLSTSCHGLAKDLDEKTSRAMTDIVKKWFKTDHSLNDLVKKDLNELFTSYQEQLTAAVSKELSERLVQNGVGIELSDRLTLALREVEIDLNAISREAHRDTDRGALIALPPTPLRSENFTVRRTFWDWILLRSSGALQRRLFGPVNNPALSIRPEVKQARLGDAGLAEMRRRVEAYKRGFIAETEERVVTGFARGYCKIVLDRLTTALRGRRTDVEKELTRIREQLAAGRGVLEPLDELRQHTRTALDSLEKLSEHYGQVDLFLLTKPVTPDNPTGKPMATPEAKPAKSATENRSPAATAQPGPPPRSIHEASKPIPQPVKSPAPKLPSTPVTKTPIQTPARSSSNPPVKAPQQAAPQAQPTPASKPASKPATTPASATPNHTAKSAHQTPKSPRPK